MHLRRLTTVRNQVHGGYFSRYRLIALSIGGPTAGQASVTNASRRAAVQPAADVVDPSSLLLDRYNSHR